MSYYRIRFPISVSGGAAKGDTGRLLGEVPQFRWYPTTADTGQPATLNLAVLPGTSDSGVGFNVYTQAAVNLGAAFTRWPRMLLPIRMALLPIPVFPVFPLCDQRPAEGQGRPG